MCRLADHGAGRPGGRLRRPARIRRERGDHRRFRHHRRGAAGVRQRHRGQHSGQRAARLAAEPRQRHADQRQCLDRCARPDAGAGWRRRLCHRPLLYGGRFARSQRLSQQHRPHHRRMDRGRRHHHAGCAAGGGAAGLDLQHLRWFGAVPGRLRVADLSAGQRRPYLQHQQRSGGSHLSGGGQRLRGHPQRGRQDQFGAHASLSQSVRTPERAMAGRLHRGPRCGQPDPVHADDDLRRQHSRRRDRRRAPGRRAPVRRHRRLQADPEYRAARGYAGAWAVRQHRPDRGLQHRREIWQRGVDLDGSGSDDGAPGRAWQYRLVRCRPDQQLRPRWIERHDRQFHCRRRPAEFCAGGAGQAGRAECRHCRRHHRARG